jgi:hypothetical protein
MTAPAELVTCDQTIERLMHRRKRFRAVATRYDKLADRYAATVAVADVFTWLRARPDQPRGDPRTTRSCPVRLERSLVVEGAAVAGVSVEDLLGAVVPGKGSGGCGSNG